jgi:aryl-alcohol dehydrogenase-like predicted oxidoreductase
MNSRKLGSTDLLVSPIGIGLAALGRPGYINLGHHEDVADFRSQSALEQRAHQVLDTAFESGILYYDAARSYGMSEMFLANWLISRGVMPGKINVGSKWGYTYTADWQIDTDVHEVKEHSVANLEKQWQESSLHLKKYLGLYQIHSATIESGVLQNEKVLHRLAELKADGTAIGLTVSGAQQPEVINTAVETEVSGQRLFDCVQATWNLLEKSATSALRNAHDAGLGVIIKEGLANGRLTYRNTESEFDEKLTVLVDEAVRLNTTIDALALAAVLQQPFADVVLSGAASPEQLLSNLEALNVHWDEQVEQATSSLVENPDEYWGTRSSLAWN